jgi:histidine ammonia-lyase
MAEKEVLLNGRDLTTSDVALISRDRAGIKIDADCKGAVDRARRLLEQMAADGERIYGVTTGFGELKNYDIPLKESQELQVNLLRSHAVGVGDFLSAEEVRAVLVSKLNSLLRGSSGISWNVIETLAAFLEEGVYPLVPEKGSLGASGDLAPLAHLSLLLIGEGRAIYRGEVMDASDALEQAGIQPLTLGQKEGLSLVNGTQLMSGLLALLVERARMVLKVSEIVSALSVEALKATRTCFDERIQSERPHRGQLRVASNMRRLTDQSAIILSHQDCPRLQDPYSIRCIPQVLGAVYDTIEFAAGLVETELNSCTDNPLCFPEEEEILSGGNFHGEHMAFCADFLGIAVSEIASISERRTDRLLSGDHELPIFLTPKPGLNSGLMIAQYTAAALVSDNKVLAHPASVDSMPTSRGMEDHVSMGPNAVHKLERVLENTAMVVALELLASSQALHYREEQSAPALRIVRDLVARISPRIEGDRLLQDEVNHLYDLVWGGEIVARVEEEIGLMD